MVVLFLALWVPFETALTVVNGMSDVWPFWILISAVVVVFGLLFVGGARRVVGPGRSAVPRPRRTGWTGADLLMSVTVALTLTIGIVGSSGVRGNLPALVLVGLLASLPMVVVACVRHWWRPRAAARATG